MTCEAEVMLFDIDMLCLNAEHCILIRCLKYDSQPFANCAGAEVQEGVKVTLDCAQAVFTSPSTSLRPSFLAVSLPSCKR